MTGSWHRRTLAPGHAALAALVASGCHASEAPPLVIATAWPPSLRAPLEVAYHRESGDDRPIRWVVLAPGERASTLVDRRGGVDLILGGPIAEAGRLAEMGRLAPIDRSSPDRWRVIRRPEPDSDRQTSEEDAPRAVVTDPRDDPSTLSIARGRLRAEGWPAGYEGLVRRVARNRSIADGRPAEPSIEALALPTGGRSPDRALRFVAILEARGLIGPPEPDPMADELLADLLGAALVDAREELRAADAALRRFGHPARAEGALGERPPWPPASVARLEATPDGGPLLETLAEQLAPDPRSRAWLLRSWSGPRRAVDGDLLSEIAGAAGGRLAREPRFRAWLRGEWTAWTRQLYRRVARLAGGYVPS